MKRLAKKLLFACALVAVMVMSSAVLAPRVAQAEDSTIFYAKDDSKLERFKAYFYNALINRPNDTGSKTAAQATIDVSQFQLTDSDITYYYASNTYTGTRALGYMIYDHLLFSSLCISSPNTPGWDSLSFSYENGYISSITVVFNYSGWNWTDELLANFKTYYADFYTNAPVTGSDFQKVVYIHDWLCNRVSYSTADAKGDFALGTIAGGKAVCAGYSHAFQFLCQQLGLECNYIYDYPTTVQHAWNKVKVDEQWFYVDVTWDDGVIVGSYASYKYFLLNDTEFEAANNNAHGPSANWNNSAPINTDYYFANKYWQDKQVPLSSSAWDEDPKLTKVSSTEHTHTWDSGKVTTPATCTTKGVKTFTCTSCGATKTEDIPASGHTYETVITKQATCGATGTKVTRCKVCGYVSKTETIPATGKHSWDAGKVTKAATTTATGIKTYTCKVCGATKTESIPKVTAPATTKPASPSTPSKPATTVTKVTMYRLYNPFTGEHLYTASTKERDSLKKIGWHYEGVGWTAPSTSNTPVYRLYNPYAPGGDHHYTTNKKEYNSLQKVGWKGEGIAWYSDDAQGVALYRQYNPYAATGTHNYTASKKENDALVKLGWKAEGIGWYGVK